MSWMMSFTFSDVKLWHSFTWDGLLGDDASDDASSPKVPYSVTFCGVPASLGGICDGDSMTMLVTLKKRHNEVFCDVYGYYVTKMVRHKILDPL